MVGGARKIANFGRRFVRCPGFTAARLAPVHWGAKLTSAAIFFSFPPHTAFVSLEALSTRKSLVRKVNRDFRAIINVIR